MPIFEFGGFRKTMMVKPCPNTNVGHVGRATIASSFRQDRQNVKFGGHGLPVPCLPRKNVVYQNSVQGSSFELWIAYRTIR